MKCPCMLMVCIICGLSSCHENYITQPYPIANVKNKESTLNTQADRYGDTIFTYELAKVLSAQNKWNLTYTFGHNMGHFLFGYEAPLGLSVCADLDKYSFSSIEEIKQLYLDVYQDVLYKTNSTRSFRPYMASFPIKPEHCFFVLRIKEANFGDAIKNVDPCYCQGREDESNSPSKIEIYLKSGDIFVSSWNSLYECTPISAAYQGLKDFFPLPCPRKAEPINPQFVLYNRNYCNIPPASTEEKIFGLSFIGMVVVFQPINAVRCLAIDLPMHSLFSSVTHNFIVDVCKKNDLHVLGFDGINEYVFKTEWASTGFNFSCGSLQAIRLEQAKALTTSCNKEFVSFSRTSLLYKKNAKERRECYRRSTGKDSPEPTFEQFMYRISFWDENLDRPLPPNIAEIQSFDGRILYFTADENQNLIKVFEEDFSQSLSR